LRQPVLKLGQKVRFSMKNFLINTLIILLFVGGLALILYPTVSNIINERNMSTVINRYEDEVNQLDIDTRKAVMEQAHKYNKDFPELYARMSGAEIAVSPEYTNTLNLSGTGIMGSLQINKIRVNLPVYHGTSDEVLQVAVGHLPETSLPVGGKSTHAVLSAHTGLPSAKLFTDLDQLEIGDLFSITVLDEVLIYTVDQILVVEPEDSRELRIFEGKDYVTLVTCTPYGINSHRLLVRGTRTILNEKEMEDYFIENDAVFLEKTLLIPVVAIPILLGFFIWDLSRPVPKRSKKSSK